jgi:regulator of sigma E protease
MQKVESAFAFEGAGMCDYRLSLLPLGGYVKIAGMVDESMDNSFANKPPKPWEFRAHPTWQKIIVICAGVTMNVILAGALYSWLSFSRGEEIMLTRTVGTVAPQSMAEKIGFRAGDEVESVNGTDVHSWNDVLSKTFLTAMQKDVAIRVKRGGAEASITVPYGVISAQSDSMIQNFGLYPSDVSPLVHDVVSGTPAEKGGLKANDTVLTADSVKMATDVELMTAIHAHTGKELTLEVKRADGIHMLTVTPDNEGHIGIHIINDYRGPSDTVHYSVPQAVSAGISAVGINFSALGNLLWKLVTGQASVKQNLAGPIAIAKMAGKTAEEGTGYLLALMASLSISLAGMNILPVPALDGGHLVFILIEGAIRREVSNKIKIAFQQVGFALILALIIFIVFNDLSR